MARREDIVLKIWREPAMVLASPSVVLMQIAHPAVARGAFEHSDYTKDFIGRFARTADFRMTQLFGTREEKKLWTDSIARLHAPVQGNYPNGSGARPYRAGDPQLLAWVYNAMVFVELRGYEQLVGTLSLYERNEYIAANKETAELMGIPDELVPLSSGDLQKYIYKKIASREVCVSAEARKIAASLASPFSYVFGLFNMATRHLLALTVAGILPSEISKGYGFSFGARETTEFFALSTNMKIAAALTPAFVRQWFNPWAQIRWMRKQYHR